MSVTLELKRRFDAPPERVFDAWLQKSWGDWVGPPGVTGKVTELEPRVGGRYRVMMTTPDGKNPVVGGVYKEITRPSRIAMSWKWEHEDETSAITLTFTPSGAGTDMMMRHEGFANQDRSDSHKAGWNGTLDKLEKYLAR